MRVRFLVLAALLFAMAPFGAGANQDASPTAIVVTPPTAEGCGDIDGFSERLHVADDQSRIEWAADFPDDRYPGDMSDDEWLAFLQRLSSEEMRQVANFAEVRIDRVHDIGYPPVAEPFMSAWEVHQQLVANTLKDAATIGLLASALAYSDSLDAAEKLKDAQGAAALSVCPAFQQVLDFYADADEGTPEAG